MKNYSDIDLLEQIAIAESRENFWAYRQYINGPKMKIGWWQKEIASVLQQFYEEYIIGLRPIYIIEAPPQHGKSKQVTDFISWLAGKNPDLRTIFAAFSERLGVRTNLGIQKIYDSEKYKKIFPDTKIHTIGSKYEGTQYSRNKELIEYIGCDGSFRNTTVNGPITGESLDIGIIDDPMKGRKSANSKTIRESTWDWFLDDFFTRFDDLGATLIINTRWHVDDPAGLLQNTQSNVKVFKYPAIAQKDEPNRKMGEALFPELKPLDFLLKRKEIMRPSSWESLYQQNPYIDKGEIFESQWWQYYEPRNKPEQFNAIIQSWDLNSEEGEKNDMTVGQTWGFVKGKTPADHRAYLLYEVRRQSQFTDQIKMFAELSQMEPRAFKKLIEAKANGTPLSQVLENKVPGIIKINPVASKELRADSITPYVMAGQVFLPDPRWAPWVKDWVVEHTMFPNGRYKDRVDTTSQALYHLFGPYKETDSAAKLMRMFS